MAPLVDAHRGPPVGRVNIIDVPATDHLSNYVVDDCGIVALLRKGISQLLLCASAH
jgi:hypothetical protein